MTELARTLAFALALAMSIACLYVAFMFARGTEPGAAIATAFAAVALLALAALVAP